MKTSMKVTIRTDHVKADGTAALYLQVFLDGKMVRFPLNISWPPDFFEKRTGKLKPRTKPDQDFNDYQLIITSQQSRVNEIFKHYRLSGQVLTIEQLKKDYYNWRLKTDFLAFWKSEVEDRYRRKKIEYTTYQGHKACLAKLKEFKSSIVVTELTPKFLSNYKAWLKAKKKNSQTTIEKNLKDIRTYVNLAIADGIKMDNPFKVVKVRHIETTPAVLTVDQVKQLLALYQTDIPENWKRVLQYFLFSCFTGLRISDILRIQAEHIIDGRIVFHPYKTRNVKAKLVIIPLHAIAREFVTVNAGKLFDTYSEQYSRRILRAVAKHLEWKVRISNHTARHTFGTNFIELGGDVVTLKEYMGHSKIQTTMRYVHISESRKTDQINVFDHFNKNVTDN